MSSIINLTTGECISGTCQSLESFNQFKIAILFIIIFGVICIELGILLGFFNKTFINKQTQ